MWGIPSYLKDNIIDELKTLPELKSNKDIDIHVEEVRQRGNQITFGDKQTKLSDFDTSKDELFKELKEANYRDLEDMEERIQLTYNEFMVALGVKNFPSERSGFSLKPEIYQFSDINNTLKSSLLDNVEKSTTMDEKN